MDAEKDAKDDKGGTPLHQAACNGHVEAMQLAEKKRRREERALQEKEAYEEMVAEAKSWLPPRAAHVSAMWGSFDWKASDDGTTDEAAAARAGELSMYLH